MIVWELSQNEGNRGSKNATLVVSMLSLTLSLDKKDGIRKRDKAFLNLGVNLIRK